LATNSASFLSLMTCARRGVGVEARARDAIPAPSTRRRRDHCVRSTA